LALVVTTEKVFSVIPPFIAHEPHRPAREKISWSRRLIYHGIFLPPVCCHSKKPLTGMRQRRLSNDSLKAGLVFRVYALALKVFVIISRA